MSPSSADDGQLTIRGASPLPAVLLTTGVLVALIAVAQAAFTLSEGRPVLEALLDLVFIATPGLAFGYTGYWLPRSEVSRVHYPRIVAWMLGGVLVMFGFIFLRDLHPGVTAEWSVGTQAIALTIGSVGGLMIGVQETRATIRTAQYEDRQTELEKRTAELEERTAELEANERELERQNDKLERFASVVSHDLRNPLSVAQGNVQLIREEYDIDRLDTVSDAHDRMETLIEDILTLARQGDTIRDVDPVELRTLCRACWEQVATGDATLSIDDPPTVMADRDRLRQLLENLFRNSVEHSSTDSRTESDDSVEHGSTESRAKPGDSVEHSSTDSRTESDDSVEYAGESLTVSIGTLDDGSGFYVADNGPGIPESQRDRVFESGYTTSDSGTGFGLAIVAEVAEAHDWSVRVTEADGGGARFEITDVEFAE